MSIYERTGDAKAGMDLVERAKAQTTAGWLPSEIVIVETRVFVTCSTCSGAGSSGPLVTCRICGGSGER